MKKRFLSAFLALVMCLGLLFAIPATDVSAMLLIGTNNPPVLTSASYDPDTTVLTTEFTTTDVQSRFFESFMLTPIEIEHHMGMFTIGNIVYYILGIMSFDSNDEEHVTVSNGGKTVKTSQELYFGENDLPEIGDEVYIAVQTEGAHAEGEYGEGSELSNLFKFTVKPGPNPKAPKNVKVKMTSINKGGKMTANGFGSLTGNIATLSVSFDRDRNINEYFVAPVKRDMSKVATGNMPFIHIYKNSLRSVKSSSEYVGAWEGDDPVYEGPNGETITVTDTTVTVEIQVCQFESQPEQSYLGYCGDENIIIEVASGKANFSKMSEFVEVEIPFNESSIGKTFNGKSNSPVEFPDVPENAWFYEAVQYCAQRGFITGYQNGKFGPGDNLKRQDFVVILARIAKADLTSYQGKASKLKDVDKNAYYAAAVNWAVDNGIIAGYQNGKFGVNDNITREQVATILYRYMGAPDIKDIDTTLAKFSDAKNVSSFAKTAVAWAVQNSIISGMADGRVASTEGASRAQIAVIIMKMDQQGMFDKE